MTTIGEANPPRRLRGQKGRIPMKVVKQQTILINRGAYIYLTNKGRVERGFSPLTEEQEERIWSKQPKWGGRTKVSDNSFGGGDGTRDGKWWGWSVDDLKAMLTIGGYGYDDGGERECILL